MENVLEGRFSQFEGTKWKGRNRKKSRVAGAHEEERIRGWGQIFQNLVHHGKNSEFDSECNGKLFLTSEELPCMSSSRDHCWAVISLQRPEPADVAKPGPGMREAPSILPLNAGWGPDWLRPD